MAFSDWLFGAKSTNDEPSSNKTSSSTQEKDKVDNTSTTSTPTLEEKDKVDTTSTTSSWLSNFWHSTTQTESSKPATDKDPSGTAKVYVWDMHSDDCGHVSIEVENKGQTDYFSLRPDSLPSVGPLTIIPLQATLARNLQEDNYAQAKKINLEDMKSESELNPPPREPDCVLNVKGLDTEAMKQEMDRLTKSIEEGKTRYQLAPNVNALEYFSKVGTLFASDNVFDMVKKDALPIIEKNALPEVYNCATVTQQILKSGGAKFEEPKFTMPWGITPNGLADELLEHNAESVCKDHQHKNNRIKKL